MLIGDVHIIKDKVEELVNKFEKLDDKVGELDDKFEKLNGKVGELDGKVDGLDSRLITIENGNQEIIWRITSIVLAQ